MSGRRCLALALAGGVLVAPFVSRAAEETTHPDESERSPPRPEAVVEALGEMLSGSPEPTRLAEGRFNPLAPVDTSGPRETLTELIERVDEIQSLVSGTLTGYLESDRLYPSQAERRSIARGNEMATSAARLLEFESLPIAIESPAFRARMVLTLRDLLARVPLPPLDSVPDAEQVAAAGRDRWRIPDTEIEIRRIDEGPRAGEWLFSAHTIGQLTRWHERALDLPYRNPTPMGFLELYKHGPFGLQSIVPLRWMLALPPALKARWLDQPVWRWLGLLLAFASSGLLWGGLTRLADRLRRGPRGETPLGFWARLAVPVGFALLLLGLREASSHALRFSAPVYGPMMIGFTVLLYLSATWIIWTTARAVSETIIFTARLDTRSIDGQLVRLSLRFLAVILGVAVVIEGSNRLGLPAYSVITGLGVGGIAVALAARESLANLMGSFIVMIEKPFRVGHWIRVGDVEGTVEEVGFRSTRIRTFYDSLVSLPSSKILESVVDNMGERAVRRVRTIIGVAYDTPPERIARFVEALRELIASHPHTRKSNFHVVLNDFSESSLSILIYFFLEAPDWATELRQREDVLLRVIETADRLGVRFAFPTRTIRLAEEASPRAGPTTLAAHGRQGETP